MPVDPPEESPDLPGWPVASGPSVPFDHEAAPEDPPASRFEGGATPPPEEGEFRPVPAEDEDLAPAEDGDLVPAEDGGEPPGRPPLDPRHARHRRPPRRRRLLLAVLAVVVLVLVAAVAWYEIEAHPFGSPGHHELVVVRSGESTSQVADALANKGIIGSSLAFRINATLHRLTILPGTYSLATNDSFSNVRSILGAPPNVNAVTVEPGQVLAEVANHVDQLPGFGQSSFETVAKSGEVTSPYQPPGTTNLEGLLGTGTYVVLPGETDRQLLQDMVDRFDTQATSAGLTEAAAARQGMTAYQLVIVASIVQKEGYYEVNMPKVARVIYNRLEQGIMLQMDSTVLYALGQDGGTVTSNDLKVQTPYNTYLNHGLTPTPICFPSVVAMKAAVDPPAGNWLYFTLVNKNGTMAFSDTYAQQLANEQLAKSRGLP